MFDVIIPSDKLFFSTGISMFWMYVYFTLALFRLSSRGLGGQMKSCNYHKELKHCIFTVTHTVLSVEYLYNGDNKLLQKSKKMRERSREIQKYPERGARLQLYICLKLI